MPDGFRLEPVFSDNMEVPFFIYNIFDFKKLDGWVLKFQI